MMGAKSRVITAIGWASWLLAGAAVGLAQEATSTSALAEEGLPASLAGFSDSGNFDLYLNEESIGRIECTWRPDGSLQTVSTLSLGGQSITRKLELTPDEEGRWRTINMDALLGKLTLERDGTVARRSMAGEDEIVTLKMKPGTILWENMTPILVSHAVLNYNQETGGTQTFPLFIVPKVVMEASLERLDTVTRAIAGRDVRFARYKYALPGVDVTVWMDGHNRVCLVDVPAQHAAYVREGYESLRQAEIVDATLSQPTHEVRVLDEVLLPMRDGVKLATDIYLPDAEGRFPLILARTPYKKEMSELQARYYARRGYAFAVQDCRGRFASEGTWEPFVNEAQDGYDTIEWLAGQEWCDGKVGMLGASYVGWVQWWAASLNPPHLVTIIPNVAPPDPFYNIPYEYGTFFLWGAIWWADVLESEATADISGAAIGRISDKEYGKLLKHLPVIELDEKVLGKQNPYWRKWIAHPTNDEYWSPANLSERLGNVDIPVFHQSGWFDGDGIGSKLNYLKMESYGHKYQKLTLGPWGHTDTAHRRVGDRDFGEAAIVDLQRDYLRWFDHWLKDVDNGIATEPLVSLFVMGANEWIKGNVYPLPQTRFEKWYLHSGGSANTSTGNGMLSPAQPADGEATDQYTYDPSDPTPSPYYYDEPEAPEDDIQSTEALRQARKEYHAKVTAERPDILVYTSEPLKEPVTIVGPVSAVLYASSTRPDTDWFVRLDEVDEDGNVFQLVEGRLRARFRESMKEPSLMKPGQVYEFKLDLWQTGIRIPAGRRVRVEVASASFPMFSRNLNTGGHNETETEYVTAEQTIYHTAEYPSHVLLPVIPMGE